MGTILGARGAALWAGLSALAVAAASALAQPPPPKTPQGPSPASAARADPSVDALRDDLNETIVRRKIGLTLPNGRLHSAEYTLTHFRPKGDGPFPIVIMQHGRISARAERVKFQRQRFLTVAGFWVRRGFAVLVPTRVGYGETAQAADPETLVGPCAVADYRQSVANIVAHTRSALDFARSEPWADAKRVIVMGVSYGGFGAIGASASDLPGLLTAINVSGGLGGSPKERPTKPCNGEGIARQAQEAGRTAKAPMLWLYAENDRYWGSDWPRRWHQAYLKGGGRAELTMFPPVDEDGHRLLGAGFALWRRAVDAWLAGYGFKPPRSHGTHIASGFADIDDLDKVPHVKPGVRAEDYKRFLNGDLPRAFAISPGGAWASRTGASDAVEAVLKRCSEFARAPCKLYAVDDMVVWRP